MEWHLLPLVAQHLFKVRGRPQVDLFASHLNRQFPCWFSQTSHQMSVASKCPVPVLSETLIKIREDQVDKVIVITPSWPRTSWYHLFLQMACKIPFHLPCQNDLSQPLPDKGVLYHTDLETLELMAWKLSSVVSRAKAFQMQLSR